MKYSKVLAANLSENSTKRIANDYADQLLMTIIGNLSLLIAERSDVVNPVAVRPTGEFCHWEVDVKTFDHSKVIDASYQNH
jgi:hypothetical protein